MITDKHRWRKRMSSHSTMWIWELNVTVQLIYRNNYFWVNELKKIKLWNLSASNHLYYCMNIHPCHKMWISNSSMNRPKCIFMSQQFFSDSAAFPPIDAHTIFYFLFSSILKPLSHSRNVQTHFANTFISVLNVAMHFFRCRTMESAEKKIS